MAYFVHLAIISGIYAILGLGLNLVVGYTGLLSVAQAAFFGVGAYTTAILLTSLGVNFFVSIFAGALVAMLISLFMGLVLSKFRGDYYALASLGFSAVLFSLFLNWHTLTRGPLGIPGIVRPEIFGFKFFEGGPFLLLVLFFLLLTFGASRFIVNSSLGRALKAIREDEEALRVFGYHTSYYKLAIFVIGAGMASLAGSLIASYITFIDPTLFVVMESVFILAVIILGGLANIKGSVLGAFLLIIFPELLRFIGFPPDIAAYLRQAVYGIILILLMLYRPQGLLGEYKL